MSRHFEGQCPDCLTWLTQCPCCGESFCPDCGDTQSEIEERLLEEEDGEEDYQD